MERQKNILTESRLKKNKETRENREEAGETNKQTQCLPEVNLIKNRFDQKFFCPIDNNNLILLTFP